MKGQSTLGIESTTEQRQQFVGHDADGGRARSNADATIRTKNDEFDSNETHSFLALYFLLKKIHGRCFVAHYMMIITKRKE